MAELGDFQALYEAYAEKVAQAERDRKPGQGLFGFRGGPKDDPCHGQFIDDMRALCEAYAGEDHAPEEIRDVLTYVYTAPLAYRSDPLIYWTLMAVHGLPMALVDRLTPEDAAALYARYGEDFPRRERMPVQTQTLNALKRRAK